jgi:prepilin-type N-terminal cleavage/methylation domain-containing protein
VNTRANQRTEAGFSLIEVIVSLAVISIVFSTLLFSQVGNLQISAKTRVTSSMKAEAQRVLETQTANVLSRTGTSQQFDQYYWACPDVSTNKPSTLTITLSSSDCSGTSGNTAWTVAGKSGYAGEGLIEIAVTTSGSGGTAYALGNLISCYDAYPTPIAEAPRPCPQTPTASGAGR